MATVGSHEGEWAGLDDRELATIYGGRRGIGLRRAAAPAILASALVTGALGALHVLRLPELHRGAATQPVVYGQPLHDGSVCTHLKLAPDGDWACLETRIGLKGVRVVVPPVYAGTCTELIADQTSGRWACVGPAS